MVSYETVKNCQRLNQFGDSDKIIPELVCLWNNALVEKYETILLSVGIEMNKVLDRFPLESQTKIIKAIKVDPSLKRTISEDRVWQVTQLTKKRPELVNPANRELSVNHYLELYKFNIPDPARSTLEDLAISNNWGITKLSDEIRKYKDRMENGFKEPTDVIKAANRMNLRSAILFDVKDKIMGMDEDQLKEFQNLVRGYNG